LTWLLPVQPDLRVVDVEQMLDRLQAMMVAAAESAAELREQGGSLADTLISAVSQHEAAQEEYFWPAPGDRRSFR